MTREIILQKKADAPTKRRTSNTSGAGSGLRQFLKTSGGTPIDASARTASELAYKHDFEDVRIHTDNEAADSAASLNARASPTGREIVFGAGQYQPSTSEGSV